MLRSRMRRGDAPIHNERGVALLITLIIITLVAVVALEQNYLMRVDLHTAANFRDGVRAYYLAKSGLTIVKELFSREIEQLAEVKKGLLGGGAYTQPLGGGVVMVRVVDEEGKINLNALVQEVATLPASTQRRRPLPANPQPANPPDNPWIRITEELFQRLGIDPTLVGALIDWIDPDDGPTGAGGAESAYYRGLEKPYAARNGPMETITELRLIKGFTDEVLLKLGAKRVGGLVDPATNMYLTAVPLPQQGTWQVNLNTAPPQLLSSLLKEDFAEVVIQQRTKVWIKELAPLGINNDAFREKGFQQLATTAPSKHYFVDTRGTVGEMTKQITALFTTGGNQGGQILYWRVQ
ncbi:MAG: type II secretion system minor pseudopilin GspK [Nitrospinae bacterium]|nr:type II secretion system minor pseudopilin GspK [Nitrospinota bacterium]